MIKPIRLFNVVAVGLFCCCMASGQTQPPLNYSRDACVKVRDGKWDEFSAFLRDVTIKLAKVRVDSGASSSFIVAQAIAPVGRSARCDYHLVTGYDGFPPDLSEPAKLEADMQKAGIAMSRQAMAAKRDELSYLVGVDIWLRHDSVGTSVKGGYARLNYYKSKPGMVLADWVGMESSGWKALAESVSKETPGMGWLVATLAMPGGASLPYNGLTVDSFPNWAALGKGIPARATWTKVHADTDMTTYMDRLGAIVERPRVDIVKFVEIIRAK